MNFSKSIVSESAKIVSGKRVKFFFFKLNIYLFYQVIKKFGLSKIALENLNKIQAFKNEFTIEKEFNRFVKFNNKIYLNCNIPGIPFSNFFERLMKFSEKENALSNLSIVQIGFTKKCPLNCEHCYEGKVLNQSEGITLDEHKEIVSKLQKNGVAMIQFGGGEPINRFDDLIQVLKSTKPTSDFWIYSSGYGFSLDKAILLKKHGLTGVSISLDHFIPELHNEFRRNTKSFEKATEAIHHIQNAGLLSAITICVTKSFCTLENLEKYHLFAKEMNVPFVQLMEPRATGNYENMDVNLNREQLLILEDFYFTRSTEKKYKNLPIIQYTGYQQRKKGCGGAGNRYIYIDTDGYVNACPFCRNKKSHFLYGDISNNIKTLKEEGCALIYEN